MAIPRYGEMREVALHVKMAFENLGDLCWERQAEKGGVVMHFPLGAQFQPDYLLRHSKVACDLHFAAQDKSILLTGKLLKHLGSLMSAETGKSRETMAVELPPDESARFMKFIGEQRSMPTAQLARELRNPPAAKQKRRAPRIPKRFPTCYSLRLPRVEWDGSSLTTKDGEPVEFAGESMDISKHGVFIRSEFLPPLDSMIRLRMMTDKGKFVEAFGKVVRRVDKPQESGFALELIVEEKQGRS